MLLIKKRFFEDIRRRQKKTTLRYWRRMRVTAGSVHRVPGLGRVRIDKVCPVRRDAITDDDASADGFASSAELNETLNELYPPDKRQGRTLYKIHFTLLR
ncbi:MAG: ASCH domain-containing protein [Planctomycetota bacterium]|jgi:hypothetical protein